MYDFFQSSKEIYAASSLARLFKHSELRMAQQLRETIMRSITNFTTLIDSYCESTDSPNDDLPNLDSRKGLTGHSALIKTSLIVGSEKVELSPSVEEIEKSFLDCVDRMTTVARSLVTVDCDLMSLLHLPPRIILNLQNNSPTTIVVDEMTKKAKASISANVAAAMVKPLAVAEEFNKYHYLDEMGAADFVESFNEGKLVAEKDPDKGVKEDVWEKYTDEEVRPRENARVLARPCPPTILTRPRFAHRLLAVLLQGPRVPRRRSHRHSRFFRHDHFLPRVDRHYRVKAEALQQGSRDPRRAPGARRRGLPRGVRGRA